jgi:hypothetical protein
VDKGGPCALLDERQLSPSAALWARAFRVRDGSYNAVAYIQNPNQNAGVRSVEYEFSLYDADNVLIAEVRGTTYIMPGGVTPVFEGAIDTGQRLVAHTYFDFTEPLKWERLENAAAPVAINDKRLEGATAEPRMSATASNLSVTPRGPIEFVAVVFDPAGNAFAASRTALTRLGDNESQPITFTWPDPFRISVGRIDIVPRIAPVGLE